MSNTKKEEEIIETTNTDNKLQTELPKDTTFASLTKKMVDKFENTAFRRAMKLVRVRISCNDTNKRNFKGEIFTVQNSVIPYVKIGRASCRERV